MSKLNNSTIKEILLKETYVSNEDLEKAENALVKTRGSLVDYLLSENIISKQLLGQAIAEYYDVMYVDLGQEKLDETMVDLVPEAMARARGVIAFAKTADGIKLGMTDPKDLEVRKAIEKRSGFPVIPFYITDEDLAIALYVYGPGFKKTFDSLYEKFLGSNISIEERDEISVKLVDIFLEYGYKNRASDIHIEPYESKVVIRFRIDGVMHDILEIQKQKDKTKNLPDFIITRLKILSKIPTDQHHTALDGKLRYTVGNDTFDIRVSVVPVNYGENMVMRLLSSTGRQFSLTDIGFSAENLEKVKLAIKNPHGMILVTGPTGSGKTTTLYAVMKILNKRDVNIATIEDPVEYDIEGISQIQVDTKTNLTFALGLRAIVRQDPDIIMVGEIRDEETASIAINSALTGHLVLSTLHTNDAATTLPRLLDMKIEPFLVASTVNLVIAQRLVRKICAKCRISYNLSEEEKILVNGNTHITEYCAKKECADLDKVRFYKGQGCKVCGNTGYEGRIGIFEVLEMS
ncbi:MAG: GspE/PulE family protein, partial [Patescibacteria group bacterium]